MQFLKRNWILTYNGVIYMDNQEIMSLLEHQVHLLNSIYAFVAFVSVVGLGGFIVYIILKPLWFFVKKY